MRITTITNQKGGVGKTTTAHALATGLVQNGKAVLLVDMDPQANATYIAKADENLPGIYELLRTAAKEEALPTSFIQHTQQCDILSSNLSLAGADLEFNVQGREYLLKEILATYASAYEYVIIDTPPTLGILTINALTACDDVLIPMGAEILSIKGLSQLYKTILRTRKHSNEKLQIAGLLVTRYNPRTLLSRDLHGKIQEFSESIDGAIYQSVIREGVAVREAQINRESIFTYAPKSNPAVDYAAFIQEYIEQEGR